MTVIVTLGLALMAATPVLTPAQRAFVDQVRRQITLEQLHDQVSLNQELINSQMRRLKVDRERRWAATWAAARMGDRPAFVQLIRELAPRSWYSY